METRFLKAGDLIECEVKGTKFEATIEAFGKPGWVKVKRSFEPNAKHHVYDVQECRQQAWVQKEVEAAQSESQRVEAHPLAEARAEQEATAINRRYGLLIRQAIIDRLKTTGTCHADDLEPLYPANELDRRRCRKLAGAQFGSMAASRGGREPLIREKERRKSSVPERKGAKSGVYTFTKAGWDKYGRAGVSTGLPSKGTVEEPDEAASVHSGGAGSRSPGSGAGEGSTGALLDAGTASPEPLSLLPEPDPESWAA